MNAASALAVSTRVSGPVLILAGGTGGHVYPALAVATELRARGHRVEWVGTSRGLEAQVVPAAGFELHLLPVRGVRGKTLWQTLQGLWFLLRSMVRAVTLVRRLAPSCVIGMGGYVAGPAAVAAWLWRRPLLIHEQNAVAGTTNRLLAPLASQVVAGFPGAFKSGIAARVMGNPVRAELLAAATAAPWSFTGERPLRLLVLGGSLGARRLNEVVLAALEQLRRELRQGQLEVWHQCGTVHEAVVRAAYLELPEKGLRLSPFIDNMARAYAWADLVVCRAGALTVAELAIMGRPALLIPLPNAIDNHQSANARTLSDIGGGRLMPEAEFTADGLAQALRDYITNPASLARMAAAARTVARPNATGQICDRCEELLRDA